MARSRNIKPGYFINYELGSLDPLARILFAGLWTIADREGRLEDVPPRIKIQTVPYDDCDVDELLEQLAAGEDPFIIRYSVEGKKYIQITNWDKHQNPHVKESASVIPPYTQLEAEPEQAPDKHQTSTRQAQEMHQHDPADSLNLIPDSLNMIPDSGFPTTDSLEGSEVVGCNLDQIQKVYFDTMGTVITKHNLETIQTYLQDGLTEWHVCRALELTSENNKKSFKYTMGILNNWLQQRAFTPEAVELLELEHQKRGSPNQGRHNANGETAAERLLREEIERERAEADIIDIAWSEGG